MKEHPTVVSFCTPPPATWLARPIVSLLSHTSSLGGWEPNAISIDWVKCTAEELIMNSALLVTVLTVLYFVFPSGHRENQKKAFSGSTSSNRIQWCTVTSRTSRNSDYGEGRRRLAFPSQESFNTVMGSHGWIESANPRRG